MSSRSRAHLAIYENDVLFNPLPTFHCFGLTVGCLMPILLGVKAVLHPTPRQPHEVVRRIREHGATILLATDTFMSQYVRAAGDDDLSSLRLAVCGAERLHDETRQLVKRKCHGRAAGRLWRHGGFSGDRGQSAWRKPPGNGRPSRARLEYRIEPVEGIREGGRLLVRGPNVMLGYLQPAEPGKDSSASRTAGMTPAISSPWTMSGYLAIRGRIRRFAKVGGETVSLTVVENCASALWPDYSHAAIALPEERRGEAIVLVTTNPHATRGDLLVWVRNHGVPELAVPRRVIRG